MMKLTWLGQAGYLLETNQGARLMIDPYFSNRLEETRGASFRRKYEADPAFRDIEIDILVLTHSHEDHTDLPSIKSLLSRRKTISVLSPLHISQVLRREVAGCHNYIQFDCGIEYSLHGIWMRAVYAAHSDERAVGVLLKCDGCTLYHTGDTLYHSRILKEVSLPVDYMMFPINGKGNNMNAVDAKRLVDEIGPKFALPMHWDLFMEHGCDVEDFLKLRAKEDQYEVLIPQQFKEIVLQQSSNEDIKGKMI